jgi:hypothetical protein
LEQRSTGGDVSSDAARRRNRSTAYGVVVLDSVIRMQKERDFLRLSVTDEYELIEKWASIAGRWEFPSPVKPLYIGPQQPNVPLEFAYRISGEVIAKVTLHKVDDRTTSTAEGRILFRYRSTNDPYISVGLAASVSLIALLYSIALTVGAVRSIRSRELRELSCGLSI